MSIYTIMQNLRRLHDAHGHLSAAWGHIQSFQRATNLNRRDPDAWDVFGLRNEQMTQIIRILRRTQRTTQQLDRATGNAPNRSPEMSRLFASWAQAYADNGEGSREAQRAETAFLTVQMEWADEWQTENDRVVATLKAMRKQRDFYTAQHSLFEDLANMAELAVRYGVTSAHQAQAFAYMRQFEETFRLSRSISRNYNSGITNASRWQRELREAKRELDGWLAWSRNRRQVNRSLESQRAPR